MTAARLFLMLLILTLSAPAHAQSLETGLSACDTHTLTKRTRCVYSWQHLMTKQGTVAVILAKNRSAATTVFSRASAEQITTKYRFDVEVVKWRREYADSIPVR